MNHLRALFFVSVSVWTSLTATALCQESNYVGARQPSTSSEIYGQGVRETPWLSPAEEQAGFHLPPGFQIELFACEPQIAKPLNMAWDARGRLWVTSSREYPYPVVGDAQPRDTLQILEDTDGDGRADKSTTFADGLNIPMGVLPVAEGAICFSIPNLWLLRDVDGDDRADERIKILGPFDTSRDTHGMVNSLTRGDDGWIYACHGFNNQSDVTAADGSRVRLSSGNTFRFREDGSRIEQVTQGQVNPFGMTRDEWGNWYSADCHSKPLTALLPGGCYPSFGRPDDGLGFAPSMMDHLHGSTAICGLNYFQAESFPPAYRQRFYSGNVMTSRINCNAVQWQGATASAQELPDFLTSDDPWFRPVDIQLGADGALYVADFYNKIIGHYEVPLDHPGRDRDSGRIWRISHVGDGSQDNSPLLINESSPVNRLAIDAGQLPGELSSTNGTRRRLAVEVALGDDRFSSDAAMNIFQDTQQVESLRMSCLELLFRRGLLTATHARPLAAEAPQQHLLVRQLALACDLPRGPRKEFATLVREKLPYANPQANRAACRLLGLAGDADDVDLLAQFMDGRDDPALAHTARIALRNILSDNAQLSAAATRVAGTGKERILAQILPAIDSELSASLLLNYIAAQADAPTKLVHAATQLATKHASPALVARLLAVLEQTHADDLVGQTKQLEQICDAYLSHHTELPSLLREFGTRLQTQLEDRLIAHQAAHGRSLNWSDAAGADWKSEARMTSDGTKVKLRSSFTLGESYTGQLVSEPFDCPEELQFLLAGHNGLPSQPDTRRNKVELQLVATELTLQTALVPRSDVASSVVWPLHSYVGQTVRLVITDGDAGKAYAWLAAGQFSLAALNAGPQSDWFASYLTVVRRGFAALELATVKRLQLGMPQRAQLIVAGLQGAGSTTASALAAWALKLGRTELLSESLFTSHTMIELFPLAKQLATTATSLQQRALAGDLVRTADGCRLLQQLLAEGLLSPRSLGQTEVLWPSNLDTPTREFLQAQVAMAATSDAPANSTATRIAGLTWNAGDRAAGQLLYQQHCAACHQLRGLGVVIGPQLDGAVVRGVDRLCEDILEPNLNVDKAFRVSAVQLDDDSVLSGLLREEPDGTVVITGQNGQSQKFPAERVRQRRDTSQSLMPANFGELLSDEQLVSLMAFLLHAP